MERIKRREKKKRKKQLKDEERYRGPDFLITKTFCQLKKEVIRKGKVTSGLLIPEISTDLRKKVISEIRKMGREIKSFRVGNKPFLYNTLIEAYADWEKLFERNAFLVRFIHYMKLCSVMKFDQWMGLSLIPRPRILSGIGYLLRSMSYHLLWIISGFGEKIERYVLSIVFLILLFGVIYWSTGCVKIQECGNIVCTLLDGLYFSVVTITTLGFGDFFPYTAVGRRIVILEVAIGCIMLAILAHLIVKKSELR